MNRALQWKLIVGFVLVFVAGGMTGAVLGAFHARHVFFEMHHRGMMSERMREHLRRQLNLTPEQVEKLSPIIDKTSAQLEQIRKETGRRVHETFADAHRQMAANLTEEQRVKLQKIESRHRRRGHGFHEAEPPPADSAQP